jgi:hypothetical protein
MEKHHAPRKMYAIAAEVGDLAPFDAEGIFLFTVVRLIQPHTMHAGAELAAVE